MSDLRQWLQAVDEMGELAVVRGADANLEIGALTAENSKRFGPVLLFEEIAGYSPDYRMVTSCVLSRQRISLTCNLPQCATDQELISLLEGKPEEWETQAARFAPREVAAGPVQENMLEQEQVDLNAIPAPLWHENDGGRYLGTGHLVIMRDPDTGYINIGTYRMMAVDARHTTMYISPGKHGHMIMRKYHQRGQRCPVAVSLGHHPLLFIVSGLPIAAEIGEYNYAGAMLGEQIEVVKGRITGLPVPAASEMVLEGYVEPDQSVAEGPFGEWTGYYAGGTAPAPLFTVEGIMHRDRPILMGCSPASRGDEYELMRYRAFLRSAMIKKTLKAAGIPGVRGVWTPEVGGVRLIVVISLQQQYAGHVKQAAYVAAMCRDGAYLGRWVIVVDEDIDPTDMNEVWWAMCTRCDPQRDIEIISRTWSSRLDPILSPGSDPAANAFFNSRAIVDACKPYEQLGSFPQRITYRPETIQNVWQKWGDILTRG